MSYFEVSDFLVRSFYYVLQVLGHRKAAKGGLPGWFKGSTSSEAASAPAAAQPDSNRRMLRRQKQHSHHSIEVRVTPSLPYHVSCERDSPVYRDRNAEC